MRLSAKAEYAIKAVLDLTLNRGGELIPIQDIAARPKIHAKRKPGKMLLKIDGKQGIATGG